MVPKYRPGALMAKFDIDSAYCNIAERPSDHPLLGMKWRGNYFANFALLFSPRLHRVLSIYSVADMVELILFVRHISLRSHALS